MVSRRRKLFVCSVCKHNITKLHHKIQCAGDCGEWFHKDCSGLGNEEFSAYELRKTSQKWACSECLPHDEMRREPRNTVSIGSRSSIGVRNSPVAMVEENSRLFESLFHISNPTNLDIMKAMEKIFNELKQSVTFNGSMMEEMKETMQSLSNENKTLRKEHELLKNRVIELENEIVHVKGSSNLVNGEKSKNVVIVGIKGDEHSKDEVMKTLDALNINISEDEFSVKVLPSKKSLKPLLVHFSDENIRNRILQQRKITPLDTELCRIAAASKRNIFINPDLPKFTRSLFLKAKELKSCGFKYVWCKDEKVLVRRNDGEPVLRIITSAQVESIKKDL